MRGELRDHLPGERQNFEPQMLVRKEALIADAIDI